MNGDKTKWIFDDEDGSASELDSDFTEALDGPAMNPAATDFDVYPQTGGDTESTRLIAEQSEKTQIFLAGQPSKQDATGSYNDLEDPVVGWLVIIKGPGLGQSVPIGVGMNTVGRDNSSRVVIGFGDKTISGSDHARVIYDDDTRGFFIAHGSGKTITKVNGQMVATVLPLANYDVVELTKTTHLRFVAFCNENFDWSDLAEKT
jgi:hypothetical protein